MQRNEWDLPPPPGTAPVKGPRVWVWVASVAFLVLGTAFALFVPIPIFYGFLPGPIEDVEGLVEVENADTYSSEGKLYLTTVSVDTQVTIAKMIAAGLSDAQQIVLRDQVTGGGSLKELEEQQQIEMKNSKQQAKLVALQALGIAEPVGGGARVAQTVDGYPAEEVLEEGDVIVEANGEEVSTTCDAIEAIGAAEPGEEIELTVERGGQEQAVTVDTVDSPNEPGSAFLGVAMEEVDYEFDTDIEVRFKTGEIAGPSAGLMFSLALYDQLTPEDLTGGREIAGTGTIGCGGRVGAIGGIQQKIAAAEEEGAEVFLVPQGNYQAAQQVADDIKLVPVGTFDDAREYLEGSA
jgi:Lon-like protease